MTPPVKILMVIDNLDPGGAQTLLVDLVAGLDKKRFTPLVCSLRPPTAFDDALTSAGARLISLPEGRVDPRKFFRLACFIRREQVSVVHTHLTGSRFLGALAALAGGAKTVISHDHSGKEYRQNHPFLSRLFLDPLDRLLMRYTDRVLAVSEAIRRYDVEEKKIPAQKVEVLHNWIDARRFLPVSESRAELRKQWEIPREACVIGAVGRLNPQKGYSNLIEAAPAILKNHPETFFVFVGEGRERNRLEGLADSLGVLKACRFPGFMPEVPRAYSTFDLFALPSVYEAFGIVLLEAMAAGLPVVASRVGGIPEIVSDGESGLLVSPGDPEELSRAIDRLLSDPDLAVKLALEGKNRVLRNFDRTKALERLQAYYDGW